MRKSLYIEKPPSLTVNTGPCSPYFSEITPITPGTQSFLQHKNDRGWSQDVWDHYIDGSGSLVTAGKRLSAESLPRSLPNDTPTVFCCVVCVLCCVWVIPGTVASLAPLSMGFSMQEYWGRSPFPSPGGLPDPGIKPVSLGSPALAGRVFTAAPPDIPYSSG